MKQEALQLSFDGLEKNPSKLRTTVRFTPEQYKIIKDDAKIFRKSPAKLLRLNYFDRLPTKLLMTPENLKLFLRIYSGIGNNCNQLAKRANAGISVPMTSINRLIDSNDRLLDLVTSLNGHG